MYGPKLMWAKVNPKWQLCYLSWKVLYCCVHQIVMDCNLLY